MNKTIFMLVLLALTTSAHAAISFRTLTIPAEDLLNSARKLQPQTGPAYSIEGILDCLQISHEIPPYDTDLSCSITVGTSTESIANPEIIIEILKQVKPMTGPAYSFKAPIVAASISQEVPPYKTTESAEVKLSAFIPATEILDAARTVQSQTGPAYFIDGLLECVQVSQEFPPYAMSSNCTVSISGSKAMVTQADALIEILKQIKPMTGPAYSFESKFRAWSISQEVPPYKVTASAEVILFQ